MEHKEMDNGLELLKKVIKSNEENIEKLAEITNVYEDILNLVGEFESSANSLNNQIENFGILFKNANHSLNESIHKIPKNIDANLSENTLLILENFEKKSQSFKNLSWGNWLSLGMSILVMFLSFYFSKKWYAESIRTKEEIRTQIFQEMKNDGGAFYEVKYVNQLELNTEIINKWIKKNPKEGDKFLRFRVEMDMKRKINKIIIFVAV